MSATAPAPAPQNAAAPLGAPASAPQKLRTRKKLTAGAVVKNVVALVVAAVFVFPVYWMFSSSLKPQHEILTKDPVFFFKPTLENYGTSTSVDLFWTYVRNSLTVTLGAVLLALLVALAASFALARMRFRGRKGIILVVMMAQMAPWEVMVIAMYMISRENDLLNSIPMLTAIYFVMVLPFTIWTLRGFIAAVPVELEEAAQIDGCTRGQAFRKVIFPLLAPGLMSTSIFGFITAWNEFAMILMLNKDRESQTLTRWLTEFQTAFGSDWGATMAASTLFALPVLIVFIFVQRKAVGGMTAGAVKG